MQYPRSDRRESTHSRSRYLRLFAAAALVAITSAVSVGSPAPPTAWAAPFVDIKPGDDIFPTPPSCGSINITGTANDPAGWRFRSSIGSGSTVFVGQKITIKASLINTILSGANGNDGPDPLILQLPPSGPVKAGAAPVGGDYDGPHAVNFAGDGSHGPIAAVGDWGYKFDANSSPTFLGGSSDGTNEMLTIVLEATGPGEISLKNFKVSGHDGTPIAGDVSCSLYLGWYWTVIPIKAPIAGIDFATVDASYSPNTASDATGGRHGVSIDVLANDSDPNETLGFDLDRDVRIASWDPSLHCGDENLNGLTPTAQNFNSLAKGPCIYYPFEDTDTGDSPGYTVVQRSGLRTAPGFTAITYVSNEAPTAADANIELDAGTDYPNTIIMGTTIDEPNNEPLSCDPAAITNDRPDLGTVTMSADCSKMSWDSSAAGVGDVHVTYTACDTHLTLTDGQLAPNLRAPSYSTSFANASENDLSATTTRRCVVGKATLVISNVPFNLAATTQAFNDFAVVDQGYPNLGPYSLAMDVLANDTLKLGTRTVTLPLGNGGVLPSQASISVVGGKIAFTPASLAPKVLTFTYRVCVDDDVVISCSNAKASVTVRRNTAPIAQPDVLGNTPRTAQMIDVAANDIEAEGENLNCATTLNDVSPPAAFTSASITAGCIVSFDAVDTYNGDASIEYRVCDDHKLATLPLVKWPATPYGFLASPGDPAVRCSNATVYMSFGEIAQLGEPVQGPHNVPTCTNDSYQVLQGVVLAADVLANDTDLNELNAPGVLALIGPDNPATQNGGVLSIVGGKIQFVAKAGFVGVDSGIYNVIDTDGYGCSATITVTVVADTDGDGIPDSQDPDANGDGIPDNQPPNVPSGEIPATGANPAVAQIGIAALLAGMALLVVTRRRQTT